MLYGFKGCSRGWQLVNLTEFPQIALKFAKMADTFPYYLGSMLVYLYRSWHERAVVNIMHASAVRNEKRDSYLLVNI